MSKNSLLTELEHDRHVSPSVALEAAGVAAGDVTGGVRGRAGDVTSAVTGARGGVSEVLVATVEGLALRVVGRPVALEEAAL